MQFHHIDPIAFYIFSWPVKWYGMMYLFGFLAAWGLLSLRIKKSSRGFNQDQLSDIVFYAALGAIIGGRVGYIIFYNTQAFFSDPLLILQAWKGGMSFHGGLIGVLLAICIYARKSKHAFLALTDLIAPAVPLGLGAGRFGNFINGELWGKPTQLPWGMVFPDAGPLTRHPSQLYEMALEGVVLFLILWFFSRKIRPLGAVSGLFAILYALFRFTVEFYREPDANVGYLAFGWLTEGQLLTLPLAFVGMALLYFAYRGKQHAAIS